MYTSQSTLGTPESGLEFWQILIPAVIGAAGLIGGGAMIRGAANESERRRQVRLAFRNLILNRPKTNPSYLTAWPNLTPVDFQIMASEAAALGMGVAFPSNLQKKANVLLVTSPTGSHIIGIQSPVDLARVFVKGGKLDVVSIDALLSAALNSGQLNGWLTPSIASQWKSYLLSLQVLPGQLVLRARPKDWSFFDWMLLGAGVVTAGYLGYKVYKRKKSKNTTNIVNSAGLAMARNYSDKGINDHQLAKAERDYEEFHWGEKPDKTEHYEVPAEFPDVASELGELVGVVYRTNKRGDGDTIYVHEFENPRPKLVTDTDKDHLFVVGGRYTIEPRGIVH